MIQDIESVRFILARMAGLPRYPNDPVARNELVRVACSVADTLEGLRAAVDKILGDWERAPIPSELRRMIQECGPRREAPICDLCCGTGFRIATYLTSRNRDPESGKKRKTVEKITKQQAVDLDPKLFELYAGAALAAQEITEAAEICQCRA